MTGTGTRGRLASIRSVMAPSSAPTRGGNSNNWALCPQFRARGPTIGQATPRRPSGPTVGQEGVAPPGLGHHQGIDLGDDELLRGLGGLGELLAEPADDGGIARVV